MILLETGLKSHLPFVPGSSRRSKMEHSDASPSLMAGIFGYFTSLTKIFSNYRFYGHIWLIICESTHEVLPETGLRKYLPFFPWWLTRIAHGT